VVTLLAGCIGLGLYHNIASFKNRVDQTLLIRDSSRQEINNALSGRVAVFESAAGIIRDHPINGIGARNYRLLCEQYWPDDLKAPIKKALYPHQLILEYAVGTGSIGVSGLLVSMGLCLRWWRRASVQQREMAAGYALTLLALYFPLNTHKSVFSSELSVSLWVLIALYTASIHYANPSESIDEPSSLTETCR
jgi:O-antigen ligase